VIGDMDILNAGRGHIVSPPAEKVRVLLGLLQTLVLSLGDEICANRSERDDCCADGTDDGQSISPCFLRVLCLRASEGDMSAVGTVLAWLAHLSLPSEYALLFKPQRNSVSLPLSPFSERKPIKQSQQHMKMSSIINSVRIASPPPHQPPSLCHSKKKSKMQATRRTSMVGYSS
jgi:hypothetical protein